MFEEIIIHELSLDSWDKKFCFVKTPFIFI